MGKLVLRCKVAILGDSAVGKTALVSQFVDRTFPKEYVMTMGVSYKSRWIQLPIKKDETGWPIFWHSLKLKDQQSSDKKVEVQLYIFDISGDKIYEHDIPELVSNFFSSWP